MEGSNVHICISSSDSGPGAVSINNICVNHTGSTGGLWNSPLNDNQCRLGQPPSTTFSGVAPHQCRPEQTPSSTQFRATQCASTGSAVRLLGRARDPLGRMSYADSVVNACGEARHNLPRSKVIQHRSSFYLSIGSRQSRSIGGVCTPSAPYINFSVRAPGSNPLIGSNQIGRAHV